MPGMGTAETDVCAAGGVVWRAGDDGFVIAVVHRPRYGDWSLPKGKLDAGESWQECAVREVLEETGLRCELGDELSDVSYRDGRGRSKRVRYWLMEPVEGSFAANDEVDELRWVDPDAARRLLSYDTDARVVGDALRALEERDTSDRAV